MNPRNRAGFALIELLIVITVLAVLLSLCAGMLHLLLKLDRSGRAAAEEAADLARLVRDFRADAHASTPVEPGGGAFDRLTFATEAGRSVEYQVRPLDVVRTAFEGAKPRRFETYRRPSRASIRLGVEPIESKPFATLVIDRPVDGKADSLYRDYRVEAEIGRNLRLNPRGE